MTLTLAFDTSGPHIAAALLDGDRVLAMHHEEMPRGQSEALMPVLETLLERAGRGWGDLDGLVVGVGPGNFTGIRISVSAARGLALGLGVPAAGVSTLAAAAFARNLPVVAAVSAPRHQFYAQVFAQAGPQSPSLVDAPTLQALSLRTPICSYEAEAISTAGLDARLRQPSWPLPVALAKCGAVALATGGVPRPAPLYVKAADAAPARDAPPVIVDDT